MTQFCWQLKKKSIGTNEIAHQLLEISDKRLQKWAEIGFMGVEGKRVVWAMDTQNDEAHKVNWCDTESESGEEQESGEEESYESTEESPSLKS